MKPFFKASDFQEVYRQIMKDGYQSHGAGDMWEPNMRPDDIAEQANAKLEIMTNIDGKIPSSNEQVITGLRLSEAVKLLEENDNGLIKPEGYSEAVFDKLSKWSLNFDSTYSVKLPPPKSVQVTRADVINAGNKIQGRHQLSMSEYMEQLCKELGL